MPHLANHDAFVVGASELGASWAYVGETATSIDARESATSVRLPAGAESVSTVIASASATPQTDAGIWIAYPPLPSIVGAACSSSQSIGQGRTAYEQADVRAHAHHTAAAKSQGLCSPASVSNVNRNVAPGPALAVAHNRPPWDSTIERVIARPMPVPCGLVVTKESKI